MVACETSYRRRRYEAWMGAMIGLFFEVVPRAGHEQNYFDLAALLRPELDKNEGLMFIDRYKSLSRRELVLSHSLWTDEESLVRWREHTKHKATQRAGRELHFSDYRLRIATLVAEWLRQGTSHVACRPATPFAAEVPIRSVLAVSRTTPPVSSVSGEAFESVYQAKEYMTIGDEWHLSNVQNNVDFLVGDPGVTAIRLFAVIRDYGMYDGAEAPQFYPPVERQVRSS